LDEIFSSYGIKPQVEHFRALIRKKYLSNLSVLIKHGYKCTGDDFEFAAKLGIDITNIDGVDISFDVRLIEYCVKQKFYPKHGLNTLGINK